MWILSCSNHTLIEEKSIKITVFRVNDRSIITDHVETFHGSLAELLSNLDFSWGSSKFLEFIDLHSFAVIWDP